MTVLVTGGAGYIGSHVVWALLDRGERVVVVDDLSAGLAGAVAKEAALVAGDVGDQALVESVIRAHGVEAIVHLAGSVVVSQSVAEPLRYYLNNTAKSRSLIESAVASGVRHFILSSTAAVYGAPRAATISESDDVRPASPYGTSKLMIELMLQDAAAAHDLAFATLRYFNVAGADPALRAGPAATGGTHLIKVASEAAVGKRPWVEIFGTDYPTPDGTCIRDYIHVADLAEAHCLALSRLRAGGASVVANLGYGRGHSVRAVLATVQRVTRRPLLIREAPRRPGDLACLVANADLARTAFGWRPRYDDLDTIVRHAVAWERSAHASELRAASRPGNAGT